MPRFENSLYVHHGHGHPPADAEHAYTDWKHRVNRQFSGVDACRVRMMHAYHLNLTPTLYTEHRYQSCLTEDPTGTLLEAAMRGVNLSFHAQALRLEDTM